MRRLPSLADGLLRIGLTAVHALMKAVRSARRRELFGAHAIALTAEGRIVLVKLRYAPGWRVPGGGRPQDEDLIEAALRELREEIGMVGHGEARLARELDATMGLSRASASLVVVRDVEYRPPGWSWEVEKVGEFELDSLPETTSPVTVRWVETMRPHL